MAVPKDQNGRVRINNLRPASRAKQILEEVQTFRAKQGKLSSLNQLFVEAVYGYYTPELKKIQKLKNLTGRAQPS